MEDNISRRMRADGIDFVEAVKREHSRKLHRAVKAFLDSPLTCPDRGDQVTFGTWLSDDAELGAALLAFLVELNG